LLVKSDQTSISTSLSLNTTSSSEFSRYITLHSPESIEEGQLPDGNILQSPIGVSPADFVSASREFDPLEIMVKEVAKKIVVIRRETHLFR
jgi:hypothetical protein